MARRKKSRSRAARLFAEHRAGQLPKRRLWAELAALRRQRKPSRRAKNPRIGYPSRRRHYGLYEWLDMQGGKRLVHRGTLDELNDWAKAQGMKWVREPGEMFGGHWHKAGRAYSFDLLSGREKRRSNPDRRVYAVRVYEYPRGSKRAFAARAAGAPMNEVIGWGRTAEQAMREAEAYLDRPRHKRRR